MEMNADKVVVIGIYSFDNASLKITFVNMYGLVKESPQSYVTNR